MGRYMGLVEHMPVWMRWGIYAWFSYFCEYLFSGTFIIDGLELCFGPVFSRGRDKDARQNDVQSLGMNSILFLWPKAECSAMRGLPMIRCCCV